LIGRSRASIFHLFGGSADVVDRLGHCMYVGGISIFVSHVFAWAIVIICFGIAALQNSKNWASFGTFFI
jgi:hypothetical protein